MVEGTFTASRAVQRQAVASALRGVAVGCMISYGELSQAAGEDITAIRHVLDAAREDVRDSDGIMFETIISQGLRRMAPGEVALSIPGYRRRRLRTHARKGAKELATVSPNQLTTEQQVSYNGGVALFGAVAAITSASATRRVETQCAVENRALTVEQTLRLFTQVS